VETNNISYNPENANDPNLPASSPITPPDIESSNYDNHGSSRHLDRGHFISERFGDNNDPHIPYKDHDRKNDIDAHRLDLSPITDQPSRKRRKVSSCDTPSLPLQSSLSRHPSESQVSLMSSAQFIFHSLLPIHVLTFCCALFKTENEPRRLLKIRYMSIV
jgi:hypothetical protein